MGLFRARKKLVGLDLGSTTIKLLEITPIDDQFHIESYAIISLPENVIVEKEIKIPEKLTEAISEVVLTAKPKSNYFIMSMPTAAVITKIVQMDVQLKPAEIEDQIQIEANRYIPYPLDEVSLDFTVLGVNSKDPSKIDVLIAAARREQVDARVDAVTDAECHVGVMDVESYALERIMPLIVKQLPLATDDKLIGVVNLGGSVTTLTVMENLNMIYTHEEAYAGQQLTEIIRQHYELSFVDAEQGKVSGGLPETYNEEVLEPFKLSLATQVARALQYFHSASDAEVDILVLLGGTSRINGVLEAIAAECKVPVFLANPFQEMTFNKRIDQDAFWRDAPSLVVACALALRSADP